MQHGRSLWTGPDSASLAASLVLDAPVDPRSPWIVPTPMARVAVLAALSRRRGAAADLGVWTWEDLWARLRGESADGPLVLGPGGVRVLLNEAIGRARRALPMADRADAFATAGYRRRLRTRFAAWQRSGRTPEAIEAQPPPDAHPFDLAAYRAYDDLLRAHDLADPDRLAAWAIRRLRERPPFGWRSLTVFDPDAGDPVVARAVADLERHAPAMRVGLVCDPDAPAPYREAAALRDRLLGRGYHETRVAPGVRPAGLSALATALAADDGRPIPDAAGLRIDGAPSGEGLALVVARRVRDRLDAGATPEEIVVAVPDWAAQAEAIGRTLRSWGIPAASLGPAPLAADPGLGILLLALRLPREGVDYERSGLLRLLRSSRLRPRWPELRGPLDLATAASAVAEARAFRGLDAYRVALDRARKVAPRAGASDGEKALVERRAGRAEVALAILERLAAALDAFRGPAPWWVQVDRLAALWSGLGIGDADDPAFQALLVLLEDASLALEATGAADAFWEPADFVAEVGALIAEAARPAPAPPPGVVRIARPEDLAGVAVPHVVVANLAEGTFPARSAIEADLDAQLDATEAATADGSGLPEGYAAELSRFLRLIGTATRGLVLVYPTADESGQALLPSAFLQDALRALGPTAAADPAVHERVTRFPAVLPEHLAQSPLERHVRAVQEASEGDPVPLHALAADPDGRATLAGTAAVLHLAAHRSPRRAWFGPFDGHLTDRQAIARIAEEHGADLPVFSASQLESLALCPFQYFLRYVLHLDPTDERDELAPDYAAEGSILHAALERLHLRLRDDPDLAGNDPAGLVRDGVQAAIEGVLAEQPTPATPLERALRAIDAARARRAGSRYADQFRTYLDADGPPGSQPRCAHCEVNFGRGGGGTGEDAGADDGHPALVIGPADAGVRLGGMIDRIDFLEHDGVRYFRVIDYKSGSVPSATHERRGLYLQLPLYTLAAGELIVADPGTRPLDTGYWSLRKDGYRPARKMHAWDAKRAVLAEEPTWEAFRGALEAYILDLVARLRAGDFPVHPRIDDCRRRCDYAAVCRIGHVQRLGKTWSRQPRLAVPDREDRP
jgi:RecB family exonuclease